MHRLTLLIPPVLVLILFALVMWLISVISPPCSFEKLHVLTPSLIIIVGLCLISLSSITLLRHRTTLDPRKPEQATVLIQNGLYRYCRNPIYLGLSLILLGWGLYLSNFLGLLLVAGFIGYINRFQIKPEEKLLGLKFGDAYKTYKHNVRRWV